VILTAKRGTEALARVAGGEPGAPPPEALGRVHMSGQGEPARSDLPRLALALLAVVLVAVLDWVTGRDLGLSLFYAIPVFAVSRWAGARAGLAIALASSVFWGLSDAFSGTPYDRAWIPWWNAANRLGFFLTVVWLSATRQALAGERERARTDPLTGLLNQDGFAESARREIGRSRRHGHVLTLGYIDCDDFKTVNDSHGHAAGDALLREVARVLATSLRSADVVGRIGGDEFVLLMPEIEPEQAREAAARLRRELGGAMQRSGWPVSFSIGLATFRPPPPEVEVLLREADGLLYAVKRSGKDSIRHRVFAPTVQAAGAR
jgi:diguanylate cyclase (GGDEF)-like protein